MSRICTAEGCTRVRRYRLWCNRHYELNRPGAVPCSVADCAEVSSSRGLCRTQQAKDWAYDHADPNELLGGFRPGEAYRYSTDPAHYLPLCRDCHNRFDRKERAS